MDLIWDGPHAFWVDKDNILVQYFIFNRTKNAPAKQEKTISLSNSSPQFKGFFQDEDKTYLIRRDPSPGNDIFECSGQIMAYGDIHGEYDLLINHLMASKVIDANLDWIFGEGHLVFCGDIFDRGDQATECLWFIYNLESKAEKKGGKVHFLLGNHETMILENDKRYLSPKYKKLENLFRQNYSALFSLESVLGQWLRSKNTLIKINDYIFVHGGLSPEMAEEDLTIKRINAIVREHVKDPAALWKKDETTRLVVGEKGPLWYRGFLTNWYSYDPVGQGEIEALLDFYGAEKIVFAHTTVPQIKTLFEGRLIGIDIPLSRHSPYEALLIDGRDQYAIDWRGKSRPIG